MLPLDVSRRYAREYSGVVHPTPDIPDTAMSSVQVLIVGAPPA